MASILSIQWETQMNTLQREATVGQVIVKGGISDKKLYCKGSNLKTNILPWEATQSQVSNCEGRQPKKTSKHTANGSNFKARKNFAKRGNCKAR